MVEDIKDKINELKSDDNKYLEYIKCFCEIDKVKEENSLVYQELSKLTEEDYDDEY